MTSPLLTVLANRESNHWVLSALPFIWGLSPHTIQWEWKMKGLTYKLLEVWLFPFISPLLDLGLSLSHFLYRDNFTLLSFRLDYAWPLILWKCLSSYDEMTQTLRILMFWKTPVLQDLMKMYNLRIALPGVVQTQRIQVIHNPT